MKNSRIQGLQKTSDKSSFELSRQFKLSPLFKAVSLSVLGMSFVSGTAQAAIVEVGTHLDGVSSLCSLRSAIETMIERRAAIGCSVAGDFGNDDEIIFANNITNTITLTQGELLAIGNNTSFTVNASNVSGRLTIDANNSNRGLVIIGGDLTFNNIIVTGATGGGISTGIDTTLTLNNSVITENYAYSQGGGISVGSGAKVTINNTTISKNSAVTGGGISDQGFDSEIIINNSQIINNSAGSGAGSVFRGNVIISNSTISFNSASSEGSFGGGVNLKGDGILAVNNTIITNNTAVYGGGIAVTGATLIIDNSTFSNNQASKGGGLYGSGSININDASFTENASYIGGGMSVGGDVTVAFSTVSGNQATGKGGGIYATQGSLVFSSASISENFALDGGGVNIQPFSTMSLLNSSIKNNFSNNYGGGVNLVGSSSLNIHNSSILDNVASIGGGVSLDFNSSIKATKSVISLNRSNLGGGIFSNGGVAALEFVTLSNNTANYIGGAAALDTSSRFTFINGTVSRNKATAGDSRGGGLLIRDSSRANISESTLFANSAHYGGGIIAYDGGFASLSNTTVSGNSATLGGGFLPFNTGRVTLTHATVSNNRASDFGGGFFAASGGVVTLKNSIVADSPSGGDCDFYNANITSDSASIIESGFCNTSARRIDPKLLPLANNGGPTLTHALSNTSPALNRGLLASCTETDQRGETRGVNDDFCDVGAFELNYDMLGLGYLPAILKILLLDEED